MHLWSFFRVGDTPGWLFCCFEPPQYASNGQGRLQGSASDDLWSWLIPWYHAVRLYFHSCLGFALMVQAWILWLFVEQTNQCPSYPILVVSDVQTFDVHTLVILLAQWAENWKNTYVCMALSTCPERSLRSQWDNGQVRHSLKSQLTLRGCLLSHWDLSVLLGHVDKAIHFLACLFPPKLATTLQSMMNAKLS